MKHLATLWMWGAPLMRQHLLGWCPMTQRFNFRRSSGVASKSSKSRQHLLHYWECWDQYQNTWIKLDVSGNVIVSGNLTVRGLLQADALKGDGSEITNINASQINQGILSYERLNGDYPGITGIGTIVSGTWNGTEISDQYIDNTLTLTDTIIQENIISGNFLLNGPTVITGNTLSIISKGWTISPTGNLSLRSVGINQTILISGNAIETTSEQGLHISPFDGIGMYISPTGSIGINTYPATSFDVNGGIKLGASTSEEDGTIRFQSNRFEGFEKMRMDMGLGSNSGF